MVIGLYYYFFIEEVKERRVAPGTKCDFLIKNRATSLPYLNHFSSLFSVSKSTVTNQNLDPIY